MGANCIWQVGFIAGWINLDEMNAGLRAQVVPEGLEPERSGFSLWMVLYMVLSVD